MSKLTDTESKEYAILVSVLPRREKLGSHIPPKETDRSVDELPSELELLTITAGAKAIKDVTIKRRKIDPRLYIGKGQAEEIKELALDVESNIVILDCDLTPRQQRNLEELIGI